MIDYVLRNGLGIKSLGRLCYLELDDAKTGSSLPGLSICEHHDIEPTNCVKIHRIE
jgi:hypothetical protein